MPVYQILIEPDALDVDRRHELARAITATHCRLTGAPPSFVRVLYTLDRQGEIRDGKRAFVAAFIRAGRERSLVDVLAERIRGTVATLGSFADDEVSVVVRESPASWSMEAGAVTPEPGSPEKAAWRDRHAANPHIASL